jgi:phosphatidylserine/phosphatidylglycerophosphate/cardiolipin synthase-like enzyme
VRRATATGHEVVGYLGGMDLLPNRLDTPGHHGTAWRRPGDVSNVPRVEPYHDVHARITGPAAADIALSFARRWEFDAGRRADPSTPALGLAFATPDPANTAEVPPQPARHLIQVGRTGYRPAAGGTPLPWSPDGEATIPQAMIRAIEQAREYIYIEDQYFTPHDEYISALVAAATRAQRLVILSPTTADQVVGNVRRREMFARLDEAWGARMIAGALVRRPVLRDAGRVASNGRLYLRQALGAAGGDTQATLGPRSRLPAGLPFWLWVEGERMLAVEKRDDVDADGVPSRIYLVRRSTPAEPLWGARPRAHAVNAPVTLAQTQGITLHTKAIIVDDVFVAIGSSNVNRRGFFHDGEITAFTVPERLKADRENPARNLRTALWAEHLGLPPAMGGSLLADPIAAYELFRRSDVAGNRLSPFDALGIKPELGFPGEANSWIKLLTAWGLIVAEAEVLPYVWNVFADPTTDTDTNPTPGPGLGSV